MRWELDYNLLHATVSGGALTDKYFDEELLGEAAGDEAHTITNEGLVMTLPAAGTGVFGLSPKSGCLLAATNFFKTSQNLLFEVDLLMPATLTAMFVNIGMVTGVPDNATRLGEWDNPDVTVGFGLTYVTADKCWQPYLIGTDKSILEADPPLSPDIVASTGYKLKMTCGSDLKPQFWVDDVIIHKFSTTIDNATAVVPYILVGGASRVLVVRRIKLAKDF